MKSKKFGEMMVFYRKNRLQENQEKFATRLSKTREYISMLESGKMKPPPYEVCHQMSNIFKLTESERKDFFSAATLERLLKTDLAFFKEVGTPNIALNESIMDASVTKIPIFDYPIQKLEPPYTEKMPRDYFWISGLSATERYFGVFYKENYTTSEISFKNGDLIIFDPLFERLQTGDFVLVKIFNEVSIKRYSILQHDENFLIHFLPFPPNAEQTSFDFQKDKGKYEIFAKAIMLIKRI